MTRKASPCVVIVAGDPGGAEAIAPVIGMLIREGSARVVPLAYHEACRIWRERGIPFTQLPDPLTEKTAGNLLDHEGAAGLLTGTSAHPRNAERIFIAAARSMRVPSLSLLDFWSNYRQRWSDAGGNLAFLPDFVAVMDTQARDEMIREGFDPVRLIITGQPAYDALASRREGFTDEKRAEIRRGLDVRTGESLVVFTSQPLSLSPAAGQGRLSAPGYTERTVIPLVLEALDGIGGETGERVVLAIRPHPKEDPGSFGIYPGRKTRVRIAGEGNPRDLVMAADLVLGMTSALLVEACYLGCIVGSIQPGLTGPDVLPTNAAGFSQGVYAAEDIKPAIQKLLLDPVVRRGLRRRAESLAPASGATRRVADLVYRILGMEQKEPG